MRWSRATLNVRLRDLVYYYFYSRPGTDVIDTEGDRSTHCSDSGLYAAIVREARSEEKVALSYVCSGTEG